MPDSTTSTSPTLKSHASPKPASKSEAAAVVDDGDVVGDEGPKESGGEAPEESFKGRNDSLGAFTAMGTTRVIPKIEVDGEKPPKSNRVRTRKTVDVAAVAAKQAEEKAAEGGKDEKPTTEPVVSAGAQAPAVEPKDATPPAAGAKPSEEGKPAESPPKADDNFATKFAYISKRDRELTTREKSLKEREAALSKRSEKLDRFEKAAAKLDEDPMAVIDEMAELGVTYDRLTEASLKRRGKVDPEVAELKTQVKEIGEKVTQYSEKEYQTAVREVKSDIAQSLTEGSEKFPHCAALADDGESIDLIYDVMIDWRLKTGETPSNEQVLTHVENYYKSRAERFNKTKKPETPAPTNGSGNGSVETKPTGQQENPPKTLTNKLNASAPVATDRKLSREEKRAKAIAILDGAWRDD